MNEPFLLKPCGKDYLWGGRRLNDEFAKNIDMYPLAETWECSTHPAGSSFVASGAFLGFSLKDVIKEHPEFLGLNWKAEGDFPILIKLIDASKDLSVQVHPDDEYASRYENGQRGKTEMWYILDAAKDAHLVYGLNHTIDKCIIRSSIRTGTLEKYLQRIHIKRGDIFFVPAGTIHAIGAGALVAEIQENSNLTYRLYDYNRTDRDGTFRPLQVEKALDVADLRKAVEPVQKLRVLHYKPGVASELLGRCKYFEVHRLIVNNERRQDVFYQTDAYSYRVLLCINGCGIIKFKEETIELFKGDCVFVPANSVTMKIHGQMQFLDVRG